MQHVLTLNSGSSSIKFAVFEAALELVECVRGQVEGLGLAPRLTTAKPGEPHIEQALSKTARLLASERCVSWPEPKHSISAAEVTASNQGVVDHGTVLQP